MKIIGGILVGGITGFLLAFVLFGYGGSNSNDPAELAKQLREAYIEEYGVEPTVSVSVQDVSKDQAESITNDMVKRLNGEFGEDDDRYTAIDLENNIIFSAILSD